VIPRTISNFFTQGLNFRLGTTGLDMQGIAAAAAERLMSV
jgi:hypothetical protein